MGKPTLHMLNRVLMCLRVAWEGKAAGGAAAAAGLAAEALLPHHTPAQLGAFGAAPGEGGVARQQKIGLEGVYHVQAVSILEEAIIRWGAEVALRWRRRWGGRMRAGSVRKLAAVNSHCTPPPAGPEHRNVPLPWPCSNVVPSFKTDSDEPIDLRGMPPAVAEVYVLTGVLGGEPGRHPGCRCTWAPPLHCAVQAPPPRPGRSSCLLPHAESRPPRCPPRSPPRSPVGAAAAVRGAARHHHQHALCRAPLRRRQGAPPPPPARALGGLGYTSPASAQQ